MSRNDVEAVEYKAREGARAGERIDQHGSTVVVRGKSHAGGGGVPVKRERGRASPMCRCQEIGATKRGTGCYEREHMSSKPRTNRAVRGCGDGLGEGGGKATVRKGLSVSDKHEAMYNMHSLFSCVS